MNSKHRSDEELLMRHYLPGENPEVELHLAACTQCEERQRAITTTLREHATAGGDPEDRPETFWKRQELGIMRRIERETLSRTRFRISHAAAAVLLVAVIGGLWITRDRNHVSPVQPTASVTQTAEQIAAETVTDEVSALEVSDTPWESDQLGDFQSVVAWESWVPEEQETRGTI